MSGPSPAELLERRARLAQRLEQRGWAGAVFTTEINIQYFSGLSTPSFASRSRPYFLLLPAHGEPAFVVAKAHVANTALSTGIGDVRPYDGFEDEAIELAADALGAVIGPGSVAFELGNEMHVGLTVVGFRDLVRKAGISLTDVSEDVWALRAVKSPWEIEKMAEIGAITGHAFDAVTAAAGTSGVTSRTLHQAFGVAALQHGADRVGYFAIHHGTGDDRRPNASPDDRPIQRGAMIWIDAGLVKDGYWSDFVRMLAIGDPGSSRRAVYRLVHEMSSALMERAVAGSTAESLMAAARELFTSNGRAIGNSSRIGHGLGMDLTEPPSLIGGDPTELVPGMALAIEPGIAEQFGYFVVEEDVVVTDGAPMLLSPRTPGELPVVD